MKRPFKFLPVGGQKVKIKDVKNKKIMDQFIQFGGEDDGRSTLGVFFGHENSIYIDQDLDAADWMVTLIHELCEAINSIFSLELNHLQISVLGEALYQAFGPTLLKKTGGV